MVLAGWRVPTAATVASLDRELEAKHRAELSSLPVREEVARTCGDPCCRWTQPVFYRTSESDMLCHGMAAAAEVVGIHFVLDSALVSASTWEKVGWLWVGGWVGREVVVLGAAPHLSSVK